MLVGMATSHTGVLALLLRLPADVHPAPVVDLDSVLTPAWPGPAFVVNMKESEYVSLPPFSVFSINNNEKK